jgi:hypothetical protein
MAGEHYISVAPDFSNAEEVFSRVTDLPYLTELTRRTREMVLGRHCLKHRIAELMRFSNV